MYRQKYIVVMFDEGQIGTNDALRSLAIATEDIIKSDGYTLSYADGDGWLTYVEFDDVSEMVMFKLKYMSYELKLSYWLLSYSTQGCVEVSFPRKWLTSSASWVPSSQLLLESKLSSIVIPLHLLDEMITREGKAMLIAHSGFVTLTKYDVVTVDSKTQVEYQIRVALPNEITAVMFRLNV